MFEQQEAALAAEQDHRWHLTVDRERMASTHEHQCTPCVPPGTYKPRTPLWGLRPLLTLSLRTRGVSLDELGHLLWLILDDVVHGAADQPGLDMSAPMCPQTFRLLGNQLCKRRAVSRTEEQ